jgi:light-regulated signal transduction histidine kinase (bacteriophytochrome)/ActR/RegA family two-component response regulator
VPADGAAVVLGDDVTRAGQAPAPADVLRLCDHVAAARAGTAEAHEPFATDDLPKLLGEGSGVLAPVAAGALVVPLAADRRLALVWFRAEQARTVDWAGDPRKSVAKGDDGVRLSPRGSFALWREVVRGRSHPWADGERAAVAALQRDLVGLLLRRTAELSAQNRTLRFTTEEREKLLEAERAARAEADRVGRMKDEFVATLSHELRTPLNAVLGWSQILRRTPGLPPDAASTVDVIERNARLQSQMIEDLLDVSRIVSGKIRLDLQPVDLSAVVRAAVDTVRPAADAKGVRLEALVDPLTGVTVTGDAGRLQQVFWNLLSNAVKFTPKGGRVQAVLERAGSHVEASVTDTGAGIRAEFLPHAFDRFRQADASVARKSGGLGIGLAIVRHLAELHGGAVRAESPGEGKGSTFVVSLPVRVLRAREDAPHPTVPPLAGPAAAVPDCERLSLGGLRVLVVDDEPDARALVARVLEECGCGVTTAASAGEAFDAARGAGGTNGGGGGGNGGGGFDVLVSDVGMPGEDGYAFVKRLRAWEAEAGRPRLPAVALTAYARAEDRRRAMLAGYQVHVAKPVDATELLAVVASLAGRV